MRYIMSINQSSYRFQDPALNEGAEQHHTTPSVEQGASPPTTLASTPITKSSGEDSDPQALLAHQSVIAANEDIISHIAASATKTPDATIPVQHTSTPQAAWGHLLEKFHSCSFKEKLELVKENSSLLTIALTSDQKKEMFQFLLEQNYSDYKYALEDIKPLADEMIGRLDFVKLVIPFDLRDAMQLSSEIKNPDHAFEILLEAAKRPSINASDLSTLLAACGTMQDSQKHFQLAQVLASNPDHVILLGHLKLTDDQKKELLPQCLQSNPVASVAVFGLLVPIQDEAQFTQCMKAAHNDSNEQLLKMLLGRDDLIQKFHPQMADFCFKNNKEESLLSLVQRPNLTFSPQFLSGLAANSIKNGYEKLLSALLQNPQVKFDMRLLVAEAVKMGSVSSLKLLLESPSSEQTEMKKILNTPNSGNMTPFMEAVNKNDASMLQLMLNHGADPLAHNSEGVNAMQIAAKNGSLNTFNRVLALCPEELREEIKGQLFQEFLEAARATAAPHEQEGMNRAIIHMRKELLNLVEGSMAQKSPEEILASYLTGLAMANDNEKLKFCVRAVEILSKDGGISRPLKETLKKTGQILSKQNQAQWSKLGPSDAPRDTYRTPSEVLVHLMSALNKARVEDASNPVFQRLEQKAELMMRRHEMSYEQIIAFLAEAKAALPSNSPASLLCTTLEKQLPKSASDIHLTRLHDNIYGNVYDSAIALNLAHALPSEVVTSMSTTRKAFGKWLEGSLNQEQKLAIGGAFQNFLKDNERFFFSKMPLITNIRDAKNNQEAFQGLMEYLNSDSCTSHENLYLTIVLCNVSALLKDIPGAAPPWMKAADKNYVGNVSLAASRAKKKAVEPHLTEGGGITKLSQPVAFQEEGMAPSQRPATVNIIDFDHLDPVAKMALDHGTVWASGVSGTTNVDLFAVKHFKDMGIDIDTKSFLLGVLTLMTYDGGHSIHEALWTANQIDQKLKLGLGLSNNTNPDQFIADFEKLKDLFKDSPVAAQLEKAMSKAKAEVMDYFEKNSHFANSTPKA